MADGRVCLPPVYFRGEYPAMSEIINFSHRSSFHLTQSIRSHWQVYVFSLLDFGGLKYKRFFFKNIFYRESRDRFKPVRVLIRFVPDLTLTGNLNVLLDWWPRFVVWATVWTTVWADVWATGQGEKENGEEGEDCLEVLRGYFVCCCVFVWCVDDVCVCGVSRAIKTPLPPTPTSTTYRSNQTWFHQLWGPLKAFGGGGGEGHLPSKQGKSFETPVAMHPPTPTQSSPL